MNLKTAASLLGSIKTAKKAASSAENGRKNVPAVGKHPAPAPKPAAGNVVRKQAKPEAKKAAKKARAKGK